MSSYRRRKKLASDDGDDYSVGPKPWTRRWRLLRRARRACVAQHWRQLVGGIQFDEWRRPYTHDIEIAWLRAGRCQVHWRSLGGCYVPAVVTRLEIASNSPGRLAVLRYMRVEAARAHLIRLIVTHRRRREIQRNGISIVTRLIYGGSDGEADPHGNPDTLHLSQAAQ